MGKRQGQNGRRTGYWSPFFALLAWNGEIRAVQAAGCDSRSWFCYIYISITSLDHIYIYKYHIYLSYMYHICIIYLSYIHIFIIYYIYCCNYRHALMSAYWPNILKHCSTTIIDCCFWNSFYFCTTTSTIHMNMANMLPTRLPPATISIHSWWQHRFVMAQVVNNGYDVI